MPPDQNSWVCFPGRCQSMKGVLMHNVAITRIEWEVHE